MRVGDGSAIEAIVDDALAHGLTADAIQSFVIAPAMVRIGDLWEKGILSVADEHLATSLSHRGLIRLFVAAASKRAARSRAKVLLAAPGGQHHVLGLRMAADTLDAAGFDVVYLGEDVPVESLRSFIVRHRPAVAGLTFGIVTGIEQLANAVGAIHVAAPDVRIMLGGRALPEGLRTAGYPFVNDTTEVVGVVEDLLALPPQPLPDLFDVLRFPDSPLPPDAATTSDSVADRLAKAAEHAAKSPASTCGEQRPTATWPSAMC